MARKISIWKIAGGLLSSCESRTDIGEVVEALDDARTRAELINLLTTIKKAMESPPALIPKKVLKVEDERYAPETPLLNLFRDRLEMTNQEVESWLIRRFGVSRRIGKSSLREYLRNILKEDPEGTGRAILSLASREFSSVLGTDTDLRTFWDRLDAHVNGDDNAIQRGTRELSSDSSKYGIVREK